MIKAIIIKNWLHRHRTFRHLFLTTLSFEMIRADEFRFMAIVLSAFGLFPPKANSFTYSKREPQGNFVLSFKLNFEVKLGTVTIRCDHVVHLN